MAKALLISLDIVGKSMAGPGIRYYELAKALSKDHEITLLVPNSSDIQAPFTIKNHAEMAAEIKKADVVMVQQLNFKMAALVTRYKKALIIDAYDPQALEYLEIFKSYPMTIRENRLAAISEMTRLSFTLADGIIAASDVQKDLWLGYLLGLKKVSPKLYDEDPTLNHFLLTVPFGLSNEPLKPMTGMRQKLGLKEDDFVLLWGGGIWNWFDPLTLIRAVKLTNDPQIKLVFMGLKHPNENVPAMKMASNAVRLAEELGLIGSQVFFNYGWTPYEERQAFLNEADVGVSTHLEHLETRYAFRTRILDYLWAALPMIVTEGDSFASLIREKKAGLVVPYENVEKTKAAILLLKSDKVLRGQMAQESSALSRQFTWTEVAKPLALMIDRLKNKKVSKSSLPLIRSFLKLRHPIAVFNTLKTKRALKKGS